MLKFLASFVLLCAVEAFVYERSLNTAIKSNSNYALCGRIQHTKNTWSLEKSLLILRQRRPELDGTQMSLTPIIGRRSSLLVFPLLLLGPFSVRGETETASMGADPLDRPGFRQYQDLTKEEDTGSSDSNIKEIQIPVNGRQKKLGKLLGSRATIVMNVKLDDPETTAQVPALRSMVAQYAEKGLTAICFPTDQGDYEPDDSATVRIKVNRPSHDLRPAAGRS